MSSVLAGKSNRVMARSCPDRFFDVKKPREYNVKTAAGIRTRACNFSHWDKTTTYGHFLS
jgi:hypothetical protein